ncbi:unnamed protein product [Rhizophagus irregularis]|nr:unnamed protein product [Rhizophagus irregularis]
MKGKGKTKGENELPKDVLLGFVSVSREGFRITEKPKDSRSVSRVGFRRTEESRFVTSSGGLPKNENPKIRTFDRVGFRRTKPKDSYFRSGGLPKNENPKILSGGLPKNENPKIRSGGLPKNEDSRSDRLPCSEEREIPRFDRVGFRPSGKEEPRFVSSGGLPKNDQRFIYTNT